MARKHAARLILPKSAAAGVKSSRRMSYPGEFIVRVRVYPQSVLLLGRLFRLLRREAPYPMTKPNFQWRALISACPECQGCLIRFGRPAWKLDVPPCHPEARRRIRSQLARTERCL